MLRSEGQGVFFSTFLSETREYTACLVTQDKVLSDMSFPSGSSFYVHAIMRLVIIGRFHVC